MAKIIQITAGDNDAVFALTDEGTVLQFVDKQEANARSSEVELSGRVGTWAAYWRAMPDISVTAPKFIPFRDNQNVREDQLVPPF